MLGSGFDWGNRASVRAVWTEGRQRHPFVNLLRHFAVVFGRSKDGKDNGDPSSNRLAAIELGISTDKQGLTHAICWGGMPAQNSSTVFVNGCNRARLAVVKHKHSVFSF